MNEHQLPDVASPKPKGSALRTRTIIAVIGLGLSTIGLAAGLGISLKQQADFTVELDEAQQEISDAEQQIADLEFKVTDFYDYAVTLEDEIVECSETIEYALYSFEDGDFESGIDDLLNSDCSR